MFVIAASSVTLILVLQWSAGLFIALKPRAWKSVHPGMSREQVIKALGTPTASTAEFKSQDSWRRVGLLNERTLVVRYDASIVVERVREKIYWRWRPE